MSGIKIEVTNHLGQKTTHEAQHYTEVFLDGATVVVMGNTQELHHEIARAAQEATARFHAERQSYEHMQKHALRVLEDDGA